MGRAGFRLAIARLFEEIRPLGYEEFKFQREDVRHWRTVSALAAVYDALEWTHSLHDHLRAAEVYAWPMEVDSELGAYVEGVIGARNAVHHGLRRVVGYLDVGRPRYRVDGGVWVHTGEYSNEHYDRQLRWVRTLPPRLESGAHPSREQKRFRTAFQEHIAGREVRNTFGAVNAFFFHVLEDRDPPDKSFITPADLLPPSIEAGGAGEVPVEWIGSADVAADQAADFGD